MDASSDTKKDIASTPASKADEEPASAVAGSRGKAFIGRHVWVRNMYDDAVEWKSQKPSRSDILESVRKGAALDCESYRQEWLPFSASAPPVWVPAKIERVDDGYVYCRTILGESKTVRVNFEAANTRGTQDTLYPMNEDPVDSKENLSEMTYLHEASVLHALQSRFNRSTPYTFAGSSIVAINPYKIVQTYGFGARMQSPADPKGMSPYYALLDPEAGLEAPAGARSTAHPYLLANAALERVGNPKNVFHQAIVMNGASGSGKTTTSKMLLRYMIVVSQMRRNRDAPRFTKLEANLEHSLHLLSSFGSAATATNDSSSRFGKFVKLYWSSGGGGGSETKRKGTISNAVIEAFKLDTSQLVRQQIRDGERNFHIFYQIETGMKDVDRSKFSWRSLSDFAYTNGGFRGEDDGGGDRVDDATIRRNRTVDHAKGYKLTLEALEALGLQKYTDDIHRLLAAILNLGNVRFVDDDGRATVTNVDQLKITAEYLGVARSDLESVLVSKTLSIGRGGDDGGSTKIVSSGEAAWRRDTLAKDLYDRLFVWLYGQCNHALQECTNADFKDYYVGVLDFPGWEDRGGDENGLSQLLINYASERFQKFFNEKTFTAEIEKYRAEKLKFQDVDFYDNTAVVKLLDSQQRPEGLFSQLEALASRTVKRGSLQESAFLSKIENIQKNQDSVVEVHKHEKDSAPSFDVLYRNGKTRFRVGGLIDQNRENLERCPATRNAFNLMRSSDKYLVAELYAMDADEHRRGVHASGQISRQYTSEMKHLFNEELMRLECLFVRCVRPNSIKRADYMEPELVQRQLNSLNVASSVHFQQIGFPVRRLYRSFFLELFVAVQQPWEVRDDPAVSFYLRWMAYEKSARRQRVTSKEQAQNHEILRQLCQEALDLLWRVRGLPRESQELLVQFGAAKVFMKEEVPKIIAQQKRSHESRMYRMATAIQASARRYIARREFLRTRTAIVDIQSHYKAFQRQRDFSQSMRAVRVVLDQIQTYMLRKRWKRRRRAAMVTTHQIRANRSRERWKHVRKGLYVVHWIARGFLLRCNLLRYMDAIRTLQRATRAFLVRNRHKWHRVVSALAIQALWRGYRIRQMRPDIVHYLRQRRAERQRSNTIRRLLASFRCRAVRERFLKMRAAAADLQVVASASAGRRSFARLRSSAIRMQSLWRGKVAVRELERLRTAKLLKAEAWRIKTIREREALQLARYNTFMSSQKMWRKRAANRSRNRGRVKTVEIETVCDVDVRLDTSEIYREGWTEGFMRIEQHLLKDGGDSVAGLAIGNAHTVILSESGRLYTWGWGDRGQLGHGRRANEDRPTLVKRCRHVTRHAPKVGSGSFLSGGHDEAYARDGHGLDASYRLVDATVYVRFTKVACGRDHCLALTSEGHVFAWGAGGRGQLGLGDARNRGVPTLVKALRRRASDVGCGASHSTALMTGGSVYTWGAGGAHLGHGAAPAARRSAAGLHQDLLSLDLNAMGVDELKLHLTALEPQRVKLLRKNVYALTSQEAKKVMRDILRESIDRKVSTGSASDAVYPVGVRFVDDDVDEGDAEGDTKNRGRPHRRRAHRQMSAVRSISCGWNFTIALTNSGRVYAWGDGSRGQLAQGDVDGDLRSSDVPVEIALATSNTTKPMFVAISAGARHAAALTKRGALYVWGDNGCGQLGLGDRNARALATPLSEDAGGPWSDVACGWRHSLAVARRGELFVWGHTLGYRTDVQTSEEDETQDEHLVPTSFYHYQTPGRLPVRVSATFSGNASISTVVLRDEDASTMHHETKSLRKRLSTTTKSGRRRMPVSREGDLAKHLLDEVRHDDDAEVQYRRRPSVAFGSPRSMFKRATGSVKKTNRALSRRRRRPDMQISRADLDRMGRRQLADLVRMLRHDEHGHGVDGHHVAESKESSSGEPEDLLQDRFARAQRDFRGHHDGARGLTELAQEHAWRNTQRLAKSPEKRSQEIRASVGYRTRWWDSHKRRGDGGETSLTTTTSSSSKQEEAVSSTVACAGSTNDDDDDAALPSLSEDAIGAHFSDNVLRATTASMGGSTSRSAGGISKEDASMSPLALYRKYQNRTLDARTARDVANALPSKLADGSENDDAKATSDTPSRRSPAFYYGRSPKVVAEVREEIKRKILGGELPDDRIPSLMSRADNMGSSHSEKWFQDKLHAKEEAMGGASPFDAGRRVSTWRDLTDAERAERERERMTKVREQREAERRKKLEREATELELQIAAANRARAQATEKKASMAARLEKIKSAVRASAEDLWASEDY